MTYDANAVKGLLRLTWDQDSIWGIQRDDTPDPDMPKAYVDPAHGNNLPAYLVDIRLAWDRADLTKKERRAVLLRFGWDMSRNEIASSEKCDGSTITKRIDRAIEKITAAINGESS